MTDAPPAPSMPLKVLTCVASWLWWLSLSAWLVFAAAWGGLHGLIVPRIGEFRPQLEIHASRVLGVPVRIGSLQAKTSGLIPSVELLDVRLLDARGREALKLPRVVVALSPRSAWRLGFEQLYIDSPELHIRRDAQGTISVAGLDFSGTHDTDNSIADWFFAQLEFAIVNGTIHWTDELRAAPTLTLTEVNWVARNPGRHHDMRLDATPPPAWGERLSLRARFVQPRLSRNRGRWQDWEGQLYAAFSRVDVSTLNTYIELGADVSQGNGGLRAWADVDRGELQDMLADVALSQVQVKLGGDLQALALRSVQGRLGGQRMPTGFAFSTEGLQFDTQDGLHWPGGNVKLSYEHGQDSAPARGEFSADRLDLAALAQIAQRLPLDASVRTQIQSYAPQGLVEEVKGRWRGPISAPLSYSVNGKVTQLSLASEPPASAPTTSSTALAAPPGGLLGLRGASISFELTQAGGQAQVRISDGALFLPGIFDEPVLALNHLSTQVSWQIEGEHLAVQLPLVSFANADAQGSAKIKWQSSAPAVANGHSRLPGVLDLQATLTQGAGTQVHRYLPSVIDAQARAYVREAVQGGTVSSVKFRVKGDLNQVPFADARQGEFRISAQIHNGTLAFVPPMLQPTTEPPWPVLTQLNGELLIDRNALQIKGSGGRLGASLQLGQFSAQIPDLDHASAVSVEAQVQGALAEMVGVVNASPLAEMTGHALAKTVASGPADIRLKLHVPLLTPEKTRVVGVVNLSGNDLQVNSRTPKLDRVRGRLNFTEKGFALAGVQARLFGGDVKVDGSLLSSAFDPSVTTHSRPANVIRVVGTVSGEGLRQAKELGLVARLATQASGTTAYAANIGFYRGEVEVSVSSNLQGLALSLPAPLTKSAEDTLALRLVTSVLPEPAVGMGSAAQPLRDQVSLSLGQTLTLNYLRDIAAAPAKVLRGRVTLGANPEANATLAPEGVQATVRLERLDLDAWETVLAQATGTGLGGAGSDILSYLPSSLTLRTEELYVGGKKLSKLLLNGSREGALWRANIESAELAGQVQYRQPSGSGEGRVMARLSRLSMAPAAAADVEALLNEQPASIPALDIVVEDFELRGKRLGRVEISAVNRGGSAAEGDVREWRLNKFNVTLPEAVFTASGNWVSLNAQATSGVPRSSSAGAVTLKRRTVMSFKLEITDAGALLNRFDMKDVVRKGRGKMEGQVSWLGSPITLDYASMGGAIAVNVENGQFLKADPGLAKLLGVLSLQSLPRRLALDFKDVFSEGFVFDFFRGDVTIQQGMAKTNNLQMKGVNAAVLMDGLTDLAHETQDIKVVVVPEINAGTASLIASAINPAVGLGTFLAQMFLRRPLMEAATQEFHIDGSWSDPRITKMERKVTASIAANPNEVPK